MVKFDQGMTSKIKPVVKGAAGLAVVAALFSASLHAQNYPARPVRMVVPTSPGGVTDVVARAVTPQLSEVLGQNIIIDNRAGAGGIPGTDAVAKAAPDGHTLLAVFDSFISNPHVFRNAPYDTLRDFAPVSLLVRGPQLLVVHPKLGVKTFNEFLATAKSRRSPVIFATAGAATSSRLSVELFKVTTKLDANLVHYKGGGPALNDLLGGHVEAMITSSALVMPSVKSGRLTALAVSSRQRSALVPGVPAISEFFPQFEAQSWVGMLAPARTPRAIVQRLNAELAKLLALPEQKARFAGLGYETVGSTPEEFGSWIRSETAKWSKVIREQNITAE
jgi:tripartite-type tricarboxylate transporter receptor subunit TctC